MAFIEDLAVYIEANSILVRDVDLFISDQPNTPAKCVFIMELAGGSENWSGHITRPVQILAKDLTYLTAEALAYTVYDLLSNKPGFATLSDIFYCDVLNRPFSVGRDQRGSYIFSSNFLFRTR